jgi:CheY-like chemotaxis protein
MDNKHKLTFTIEDTGIGMREDKIEEVFQPFSQADSSTTRYYGGTGLGLSIARQLSQLMGGDISATSTEFKGSTFTFEIDIKLPSQTPIHQKISAPNLDKLPILLLSTTPLSDNILENILIGLNARVTKLNMPSGEDSFQHCDLDKLQPKIVILSLPTGKQAIEVVLSKLKDEPLLSQIPTLLNYSTIDAPVISHYIKQQIYAGFNKPIYQPELMTLLTNYSQDQLSISKDTVIESNDDWQLTKHFGSTQPRLLLAEDNMVNQLVAEGIINEFGLEIEIANNGIQALELLEKSTCDNPYHLIFMDCQMPKLDGYQTTQKIRAGEVGEIYKTIPIVAMTANAMVGDKEKCLNAGMNDYISKPLEPEHIRKALLASLAYLIDEDKRHHSG